MFHLQDDKEALGTRREKAFQRGRLAAERRGQCREGRSQSHGRLPKRRRGYGQAFGLRKAVSRPHRQARTLAFVQEFALC